MPANSKSAHAFADRDKRRAWARFIRSLDDTIEPSTLRLMDSLRFVTHSFYRVGESSVDGTGLSYAKYRLLLGLLFAEEEEERSGLAPSEISDRQGTSRNTISALVRDLEEEGLVTRRLDEQDRRRFIIRLSDAGRARVRDHARQHIQFVSRCFSGLDGDEQETLGRLLTRLVHHFESTQAQSTPTAPKS